MEPQAPINDRLSNQQSDVRAAALAEIFQSGVDVSPYVNAVAACLNDSFEPLRVLALMLLARIGAAAAEFIALALSRRQADGFRATAAAILAGMGPSAAAAVPGLCRCLDSPDETLRKAAGIALAKIGDPAVPALRLILPLSNHEAVAAAIDALAMIGRPAESVLPDLEGLAATSPPKLQLACAAAISSIAGDPQRGLPVLTMALENPDPSVRKTAAEKIAALGVAAHPAIPNLLRCTADPGEAVRTAALLTLGRIQAPPDQAMQAMIHCLGDPAAEVRYSAVIVLANYGARARAALQPLYGCLQDPAEKVAKAANAAIQKINSPAS